MDIGTIGTLSRKDVSPTLILAFYRHAIIAKQFSANGGVTEFAVSPDELQELLGKSAVMDTGILPPDVIKVAKGAGKWETVSYRAPQIMGLWLEGSTEALRVPQPGLVMVRRSEGSQLSYRLFAVKERPTLSTELYAAPLPNVTVNGTCWGTVSRPKVLTNDLSEDWRSFLGSRFGNHHVKGSSHQHPNDIRKMLLSLDGQDEYPLDDLVSLDKTLGEMVHV